MLDRLVRPVITSPSVLPFPPQLGYKVDPRGQTVNRSQKIIISPEVMDRGLGLTAASHPKIIDPYEK